MLTYLKKVFIKVVMQINIKKLESERTRLSLKKYQFAKLLGIDPATYTYICRTKSQKLSTINKIAKRLSLDPKDLLT